MSDETKELFSKRQSNLMIERYNQGRSVSGGYTTWWTYKDIKVQGSFEYRMCYILDAMINNNEIMSWEYTNDRIDYVNIIGKNAKYLLDFKVYLNETDFYYVETKGYQRDNDILKWTSTREQGYNLKVYFKDDLKLLEEKYNL